MHAVCSKKTNKQVLSGDCQEGQSRAKLYSQHQVNGEHLRAAYASQLWGNMTDRKGTWASIRSAILNGAGRKQREQRIRVISTDTERTTASAIALVQALFDIDASALAKNPSAYVRLQTHATSYDPWRAYDFGDFERYFFDGAEADSPELQEYVASDFYVDTARQWKEETGSNVTLDFGGLQVMQPLCAGLALPISKQLLLDVYRASEEYQSRIFSNSGRFAARMTALEMGPLALHILGFIDAKLQSSQQQAQQVDDLVLHSFHDTSVMFLLQGLRLDWNGRFPMFAELVVLEIYTLADGSNATSGLYDDKVFRWLRNGEWLPATYPGCVAEYEDFDTQLCPLGVLIDHLESIALTMPEYAAQVAKLTATDGSSCPPGPKHKQRAKADLSLLVFFFGVVVGLQVAAFAWCMAKQGRDGECCQQASHWVRRNNPRNQHTYLYDSYEEGTRDDGDLSSFESENGNMISNLSDKDL